MPPCSLGAHPPSPASCVSDGLASSPGRPTSPWNGRSPSGWLSCCGPGPPTHPCAGLPCRRRGGSLTGSGFRQARGAPVLAGPGSRCWAGRCSSDPGPLQRGPYLRSWPPACAALRPGPSLWGCPPSEGSGWLGVWGSLARCVSPVTGTAWPSAGRGSSCLCTRAEWLASRQPSGPRAASALPAPHLCALPGCYGVLAPPRPQMGSDQCPARLPRVYHPLPRSACGSAWRPVGLLPAPAAQPLASVRPSLSAR